MRFACLGIGVLMLASGFGCRWALFAKTGDIDAGGTLISDAGVDDHLDVGGPVGDTADAPVAGDAADAPVAGDAADAPATDDAADAPGPSDAVDAPDKVDAPTVQPVPCMALRTVSILGPLTPYHAKRALFSPDRRLLVLQAAPLTTDGAPPAPTDVLLLVPLPIGNPKILGGIMAVEWLGTSGNLLATLWAGNLGVVTIDTIEPRVIARGTCAHLATPDGSRLFVLRDCTSTGVGALDEIDVASGVTTPRAPLVSRDDSLAISPSGRFLAYLTASAPDGGGGGGVLHVLDGDHDQALVARAPARAPVWLSDERVLFVDGTRSFGQTDAYVHTTGTGDAAQLVAQNRHLGFNGYRLSPDRSLVLASLWATMFPWANTLYAVHLDGSGEQLLTGKMYAYHMNQIALTPFAFSADGMRAIYVGPQDSMAGIYAASVDGSTNTKLADGYGFVVSPFADRVAAIEVDFGVRRATMRIVASATGSETVSFTTGAGTAFRAPTFVPGDRGLLYIEYPMTGTGPTTLHHISFVDGRTSLLGGWNRSQLPITGYPIGELAPGYPWIDPTGCFAIVDSDLPDSQGTSLVVLPDAPE